MALYSLAEPRPLTTSNQHFPFSSERTELLFYRTLPTEVQGMEAKNADFEFSHIFPKF